MSTETKRNKEKQVVQMMIGLYCRNNHHQKGLCGKCQKLVEYAHERIENCPFMESKTFCSNCKVHCYKDEMRQQIREVMRYSGPRMIFHNPIMAISHLLESRKEK